jgi:DNA-damage-inducible protein J
MAQTALIQVRVDEELKQEVEALLNGMGMDTSTAVRVFLKQVIAEKRIPFVISSAGDQRKLKEWKGLIPGMKESGGAIKGKRFSSMDHSVHLGTDWKWNREELYDRSK